MLTNMTPISEMDRSLRNSTIHSNLQEDKEKENEILLVFTYYKKYANDDEEFKDKNKIDKDAPAKHALPSVAAVLIDQDGQNVKFAKYYQSMML